MLLKKKLIIPPQGQELNGTVSTGIGLNPRSRIEYSDKDIFSVNGQVNLKEIPGKVKAYYSLGFRAIGESSGWVYGDCICCGGGRKLYIEIETGRPSCKVCGVGGNIYTLLRSVYNRWQAETDGLGAEIWTPLEKDRGIEAEFIRESGIVYNKDQMRWFIPVYNKEGKLINFRVWKLGPEGKEQGIALSPLGLWGAENLKKWSAVTRLRFVYKTEAFWDGVALRAFLSKRAELGDEDARASTVIASPGAGQWRDLWSEWVIGTLGKTERGGAEFILVHDNDNPGARGAEKVAENLLDAGLRRERLKRVIWPIELPDGFDFRDFYKEYGYKSDVGRLDLGWGSFQEATLPFKKLDEERKEKAKEYTWQEKQNEWREELEPLVERGKKGLDLEWLIGEYSKWLHMNKKLEDGLRVVYAVILANQLQDTDPLWVHLIGPPGCGKTQLLSPCQAAPGVRIVSTVTPASLVSGYNMKGERDPSLLPELMGKTFGFKDLTELLQANQNTREEVFGTLRNAYDGKVFKPFGNGVVRDYQGFFSMITCVTNAIYGHSNSIMGERFLFFRVGKTLGDNYGKEVEAAMTADGIRVSEELGRVAAEFLSYRIESHDLPPVPYSLEKKLIALAQLIGILRSRVEKDKYTGILSYDPAYETGTRPGKQLLKLLLGLGLQRNPPEITDEDYRIVAKCALDSCISWNVDIIMAIAEEMWDDQKEKIMGWRWVTRTDLQKMIRIPDSTMYNQLSDMVSLGALEKVSSYEKGMNPRGRPLDKYRLTPLVYDLIVQSGLIGEVRKNGWLEEMITSFKERQGAGVKR